MADVGHSLKLPHHCYGLDFVLWGYKFHGFDVKVYDVMRFACRDDLGDKSQVRNVLCGSEVG